MRFLAELNTVKSNNFHDQMTICADTVAKISNIYIFKILTMQNFSHNNKCRFKLLYLQRF